MTQNNNTDIRTNEVQNKHLILEIVKEERPETVERLIELIQQKTALPAKEIKHLLIQLENEKSLHFATQSSVLPSSISAYALSRDASWYWLTIAFASFACIIAFVIPQDSSPLIYLRYSFGALFLLFLPGYVLIKALFPLNERSNGNKGIDVIERVALSTGMSFAVVSIVCLALSYVQLGLQLTQITLSMLVLTVVVATIGAVREHNQKLKLQVVASNY